mgnify:CR=1 FL=1
MNNATLKLFQWSLKQIETQLAGLIPRAEDYRQVIHKEEARRAAIAARRAGKATNSQAPGSETDGSGL